MDIWGAVEVGAPGFVGVGFVVVVVVVGVGGALPLAWVAMRSACTATEVMRSCFSVRWTLRTMSWIMLKRQSSRMEGICIDNQP
jgi:hypothetical protein